MVRPPVVDPGSMMDPVHPVPYADCEYTRRRLTIEATIKL
jgi:hypothetical protein